MQYSTSQLIANIQAAATAIGVDPNIAVEQARQESVGFAIRYVYGPSLSPANAAGLWQFIQATGQRYGLINWPADWFDPDKETTAWQAYFSFLLQKFNGRYDLALAGYNWGENHATLAQALSDGQSILNYSIPAETSNYVQTILSKAGYDPSSFGPSGGTPSNSGGSPVIDLGSIGTVDVSGDTTLDTGAQPNLSTTLTAPAGIVSIDGLSINSDTLKVVGIGAAALVALWAITS